MPSSADGGNGLCITITLLNLQIKASHMTKPEKNRKHNTGNTLEHLKASYARKQHFVAIHMYSKTFDPSMQYTLARASPYQIRLQQGLTEPFDLWMTPADPCMTFDPINVLHFGQRFFAIGHSCAI